MIKALAFDYGGVVGPNSNPAIFRVVGKEFGLDYGEIEEAYERLGRKALKGAVPVNLLWKSITEELGVEEPSRFRKAWLDTYEESIVPDRSVVSLIRGLRKEGYKVAMISNNSAIYRGADRKRKSVRREFDLTLYSYDVGAAKPERRIYKALLKRLGVRADECVILDDLPKYLVRPGRMGFKTVLFLSPAQAREDVYSLL
jgi:putative hydrolase of the HAD superfamily